MAEDRADLKIVVGSEVDEASAEQTGKDIVKTVKKGIGNNGYIKLPVEITKFKYPKRDEKALSGPRTIDYSGLQKAQDELLSSWKKLSKKGFSSDDESVFNSLKAYREYEKAVKKQYSGTDDLKDPQVMKIRSTIGNQLTKYFTRLAPANFGDGKQGSFMRLERNSEFEKYAKTAIRRYKVAQEVGIDLSKSELSKEDRSIIIETEKKLLKQAYIDKTLAQRKYEKEHAKEIKEAEQKELQKIEKERAETSEKAIPIPKSDKPLDDVTFKTTKVEDLTSPRDYTPTAEDKKEDKQFLKNIENSAPARKINTPNNELNLGTRQQVWDPTYLTKDFIQKMERGGTYVDTNALLRQTMQALPEEIKNSINSLVVKIDKDEALKAFTSFDSSEKKQWSDISNQTGMSKLLLANVAKVQGALMGGKEGVSPEDLKNAIIVAINDALQNGKSAIAAENYNSAIASITNMLMNRYNNMKEQIGSTDGSEYGVGVNYEEVAKTLKEIFKNFEDTAKELLKRAIKEFPDFYGDKNSNSKNNKKETTTTFDQVFNEKLNAQTGKLAEIKDTLDKTLNYSFVENSEERKADSKEAENSEELQNIAKTDATTGANTDDFAKENFSHQTSTNRLLGDIKELLIKAFGPIKPSSRGNISGNGGNGSNGGNGGNGSNRDNNFSNLNNSCESILLQIVLSLKNIDVNVGNILQSIIGVTGKIPNNLPAIIDGQGVKTHPVKKEPITDKTDYNRLHDEKVAREVEAERTAAVVHNWVQKYVDADRKKNAQERLNEEAKQKYTGGLEMSKVISSTPGFFGKLQDTISKAFSSQSEADRIMSMNRDQQARMRAQRLEIFGESQGRSLTDTGDKASVKRTKELFGWIYKNDGKNKELFQDVRLTPGFNKDTTIDTTKILNSLNKVLSGPEMFKAQTGGTLRNIIGSFTGYIGMPSIEKSRAQADGLNQVMSNVRNEMTKLVQSIQAKEMTLKGMQEMGTARFDNQGRITEDSSSAARKTFIDLEEQKGVLRSALAEVLMIDQVVGSTGGKISQIVKKLGFVMPELMENNTILQNINAGLDKNGKALKFQTRTAEILNYSFQLMSRHIGQIVKNWLWMINPINLLQRAFQDFASYNVKWQRTMNVIKYNLRRIIRPFMEWLAQQVVNLIGLVNALIKGIGKAFGKDWDLFDKDAANAEKINEELQEAADTSAGFDELHDIGSTSENSADNLLGDIYTPQWEGVNNFLENIGEKIGKIFDTIKGWNFWNWLAIGGAALAGFLILKTLLSWFSGKSNPLQTLANGFSFLEKAVGWTLLIWAFTEFTKALTDFVECMKTADWEDIAKSLIMLGGAFALLVAAIGGIQGFTALVGMNWQSLFGLSALVGVFDLFIQAVIPFMEVVREMGAEDIAKSLLALVGAFAALAGGAGLIQGLTALAGLNWQSLLGLSAVVLVFSAFTAALVPFVEALKGATTEDLMGGLIFLAGALTAVAVAVGILAAIFTAITSTGIGLAALGILTAVLAVVSLVILAMAELVRALGESGEGIKSILEGVATVITSIGEQLSNIFQTIGNVVIGIVEAIANGIKTVLEPILDFIDSVIGKITDLATTIAHEIGETIRTVIKTTGNVIVNIIDSLVNAIPKLLSSILNFVYQIGPAIENSSNAIMRTITKLINFVISGIEYLINTLVIGTINSAISTITLGAFPQVFSTINIPRFVPQYEQGTNYVPNDGLAYLHQGEAVVPKKYNQPISNGLTSEERVYMQQIMSTMRSLDNTMKQGISVKGQFVQRGSDLVSVINKTKSQTGADLLSNVSYAR